TDRSATVTSTTATGPFDSGITRHVTRTVEHHCSHQRLPLLCGCTQGDYQLMERSNAPQSPRSCKSSAATLNRHLGGANCCEAGISNGGSRMFGKSSDGNKRSTSNERGPTWWSLL